jgi:chemosensory pili system protein ChpE
METLFFSAFVMSITFAMQPGMVTFESIRRGLERGWRAPLVLLFGSLVGDATWALIALIGVSFLFQYQIIALGLSLFGCYLLLRFAWSAWKVSRQEINPEPGSASRAGDFVTGASLSLSNPQNISFWVGMSGTIIGLGFLNPEPSHLGIFFTGFMTAQVMWCFFFAALVELGRQFIDQRFFRWINLICAAVLAYLGIRLLIGTIRLMF